MRKKLGVLLLLLATVVVAGCGKAEPVEITEPTVTVSTGYTEPNIAPTTEYLPTEMAVHFILNKEFVEKYEYEDSKNYCFAFNIMYKGESIGYYDVYRNVAGGVSNDANYGLVGCIPAYKAKEGWSIVVPFDDTILVAKGKGEYGFKETSLSGLDYRDLDVTRSTTRFTGVKVMDTYIEFR